ncbi:sugar transferase, partial [Streptococcus suis]
KLGTPIFFTQERPGKDEKIFKMYKFRTMTDEQDANGHLLPDSVRLTSFGKFLRSTSLDELPELWNILKGDMSIVGPRPLLIKYLPYYSEREKFRHSVRPGLTGLSQINGRNCLDWDTRLELDVR